MLQLCYWTTFMVAQILANNFANRTKPDATSWCDSSHSKQLTFNTRMSSFGFLAFIVQSVNAVVNVANNINDNNNNRNNNNNDNNNNQANTNIANSGNTQSSNSAAGGAGRRVRLLDTLRQARDTVLAGHN